MDVFAQAAEKIIHDQEAIIGPLALEQARRVTGLTVDTEKNEVTMVGNKTDILNSLVGQYKGLFGQTSVEVCKDAVRGLLSKMPSEQVPALLR